MPASIRRARAPGQTLRVTSPPRPARGSAGSTARRSTCSSDSGARLERVGQHQHLQARVAEERRRGARVRDELVADRGDRRLAASPRRRPRRARSTSCTSRRCRAPTPRSRSRPCHASRSARVFSPSGPVRSPVCSSTGIAPSRRRKSGPDARDVLPGAPRAVVADADADAGDRAVEDEGRRALVGGEVRGGAADADAAGGVSPGRSWRSLLGIRRRTRVGQRGPATLSIPDLRTLGARAGLRDAARTGRVPSNSSLPAGGRPAYTCAVQRPLPPPAQPSLGSTHAVRCGARSRDEPSADQAQGESFLRGRCEPGRRSRPARGEPIRRSRGRPAHPGPHPHADQQGHQRRALGDRRGPGAGHRVRERLPPRWWRAAVRFLPRGQPHGRSGRSALSRHTELRPVGRSRRRHLARELLHAARGMLEQRGDDGERARPGTRGRARVGAAADDRSPDDAHQQGRRRAALGDHACAARRDHHRQRVLAGRRRSTVRLVRDHRLRAGQPEALLLGRRRLPVRTLRRVGLDVHRRDHPAAKLRRGPALRGRGREAAAGRGAPGPLRPAAGRLLRQGDRGDGGSHRRDGARCRPGPGSRGLRARRCDVAWLGDARRPGSVGSRLRAHAGGRRRRRGRRQREAGLRLRAQRTGLARERTRLGPFGEGEDDADVVALASDGQALALAATYPVNGTLLFERSGTGWQQVATLRPDAQPDAPRSVALAAGSLVVGSPAADDCGAAPRLPEAERQVAAGRRDPRIRVSARSSASARSVAISGATILVGAEPGRLRRPAPSRRCRVRVRASRRRGVAGGRAPRDLRARSRPLRRRARGVRRARARRGAQLRRWRCRRRRVRLRALGCGLAREGQARGLRCGPDRQRGGRLRRAGRQHGDRRGAGSRRAERLRSRVRDARAARSVPARPDALRRCRRSGRRTAGGSRIRQATA